MQYQFVFKQLSYSHCLLCFLKEKKKKGKTTSFGPLAPTQVHCPKGLVQGCRVSHLSYLALLTRLELVSVK